MLPVFDCRKCACIACINLFIQKIVDSVDIWISVNFSQSWILTIDLEEEQWRGGTQRDPRFSHLHSDNPTLHEAYQDLFLHEYLGLNALICVSTASSFPSCSLPIFQGISEKQDEKQPECGCPVTQSCDRVMKREQASLQVLKPHCYRLRWHYLAAARESSDVYQVSDAMQS